MKDSIPTKTRQLDALAEFRYNMRRFLHFSETVAELSGLHAQQYQLMQVAASQVDGVPPTIAYIAFRMMLRHNSAVGLIDRTEKQGLLRRVPDENDHRCTRVRLTPKGERVLNKLVDAHLTALAELGPEMQRTLDAVIKVNSKQRREKP
jgi:DNA-binding MarR family transcriptional regulator